jgi:hypothetical protein
VPERKLGFFVKIKEDDPPPNFGGLTTVILIVFRGLKFESDADIGGKDSFRSGTSYETAVMEIIWVPKGTGQKHERKLK